MQPTLSLAWSRPCLQQNWQRNDAKTDHVTEKQFVHVANWPTAFQLFVDVFDKSNIALCNYRLRFIVCVITVNAFVLTELADSSFKLSSFSRPNFQWFCFGDKAAKSFLTFGSHWLKREFL